MSPQGGKLGKSSSYSHLNVVDDQSVDVQTLVVSIGLGVLQQLEEKVGGFLWPATDGSSPCLGLGSAANTAVETAEGNALLLLGDVLQEALSATEGHAFDRKRCLACVLQKRLKMSAKFGVEFNFCLP